MGSRRFDDVAWLPRPNVVVVGPPTEPTDAPCTAAFVLARDAAGRLLLVEHARRGPDLPGGHVEPGEQAVEAAARELAEETGVTVDVGRLRPLGTMHCELHGPRPEGYGYPWPCSSMQVFAVELTQRDVDGAAKVVPDDERCGRRWVRADEVDRLCPGAPWAVLLG